MKILIIEWASFGKEDIDDAFKKLGHHIVKFSHPDYDLCHSDDFISSFSAFMEKENADLVFSSNYFPLVSKVCKKFNKPYAPDSDGVETDSYIYSRYFIDRKITELERKNLLGAVSDNFNANLYTHNPTPYLPNIHNLGAIDHTA